MKVGKSVLVWCGVLMLAGCDCDSGDRKEAAGYSPKPGEVVTKTLPEGDVCVGARECDCVCMNLKIEECNGDPVCLRLACSQPIAGGKCIAGTDPALNVEFKKVEAQCKKVGLVQCSDGLWRESLDKCAASTSPNSNQTTENNVVYTDGQGQSAVVGTTNGMAQR